MVLVYSTYKKQQTFMEVIFLGKVPMKELCFDFGIIYLRGIPYIWIKWHSVTLCLFIVVFEKKY